VLVEIARKKQEWSMVTQFKKCRDPQAKTAGRQTAASTTRKRTKEIGGQISNLSLKDSRQNFLGVV
jgi:hypothetical protein